MGAGGRPGYGSGGNTSDGEQWGAADEASLSRLPLTSCCVAQVLTGHGPVLGSSGVFDGERAPKVGPASHLLGEA